MFSPSLYTSIHALRRWGSLGALMCLSVLLSRLKLKDLSEVKQSSPLGDSQAEPMKTDG